MDTGFYNESFNMKHFLKEEQKTSDGGTITYKESEFLNSNEQEFLYNLSNNEGLLNYYQTL